MKILWQILLSVSIFYLLLSAYLFSGSLYDGFFKLDDGFLYLAVGCSAVILNACFIRKGVATQAAAGILLWPVGLLLFYVLVFPFGFLYQEILAGWGDALVALLLFLLAAVTSVWSYKKSAMQNLFQSELSDKEYFVKVMLNLLLIVVPGVVLLLAVWSEALYFAVWMVIGLIFAQIGLVVARFFHRRSKLVLVCYCAAPMLYVMLGTRGEGL